MKPKGFALATILILLGVILFATGALISVSVLESKIARSQQEGMRAYYVSEAGAEDALWRLGTTPAYSTALINGNLNVSYASAANIPGPNQSFAVTLKSTAPQYATVTITGTSANNSFTAQRVLVLTVFQAPPASPTGNYAMLAGAALTITNGNANTVIRGGDMYSGQTISFHSANLDLGSGYIKTPGNYVHNGAGTITAGGVNALNYPPAAPVQAVPGLDFTYYSTNNTVTYTPAQFQALVSGGGATVTIPGPITYINGPVSMTSWARNKTLNITGMLIVNGSLTVTSAASNLNVTINDPGNGMAGLFLNSSFNDNAGNFTINGVFYTSSNMTLNNSQNITVNGGMVAAGGISINTGLQLNLTYVPSRVTASFSVGTPQPVRIQHWEEQY